MLLSCADALRPLSQPPALGRSSLSRLPPGAPLRFAPRLPCLRPLRGFRRLPPAASPSVVDRSLRRRVVAEAPGGVRGMCYPRFGAGEPTGDAGPAGDHAETGVSADSPRSPRAPAGATAAPPQPQRVRPLSSLPPGCHSRCLAADTLLPPGADAPRPLSRPPALGRAGWPGCLSGGSAALRTPVTIFPPAPRLSSLPA